MGHAVCNHCLRGCANPGAYLRKSLLFHLLAINPNALGEAFQIGRGKKAGTDALFSENRIQICANRALPIGACHMDRLEALLWVT